MILLRRLVAIFTRHDGWFESDNTIVTNCFGHIIESQPPKTIILNTKSGRLKHSFASLSRKIPASRKRRKTS